MVRQSLSESLSRTARIVVDKPRTIDFMGEAWDVVCHDAIEKVAAGEHKRFVVDLGTVAERLKAKIANSGQP